ncbi:organic cation transporter protein [Octopus vulgaris]|uniref:Organic cation transporter protein n=1 Tax=Octopus vulgaris TaxID=6645 RepID=A0AA36ATC4_OCTVU|nr:organic cation transporter protein [Octopus vulgaris]
MFSYEQIFEELRGFGPYQRRLFILVSLLEISAGLAMVLPIFTHAKMNWYCVSANYSEGTNTTVTPDWNNTQRENSNSSDKLLSLSCNALLQKEQCSKIIFDSEFTSIVSEWNLVCDQSYTITLINTLTMVGLLFGSLLTGPLSDYFGRKKILYGSYFLLLIFQIASGLTVSWQVYCGCRVLIGAFITCVMISNYILPMEFIVPKWRTVVGCVGFWAIGICLTSLWAYLIRDWRILTISSACFGFPFLLTWWFGRKRTIFLLVSSTGVLSTSVLIFHIFETASNYETVITVIITLAKSTGTGAWAALQVLTAEMFPTVVRSLGIAACSTMARIGAIIAMLILTLDELGKLIPFIIFGIECILFSVVLLFLPETSGLPLKDILNK